MRSSSKRIVIIGAGPGGLASAMLLSKAGFDVTVLERKSQVGGRTSTLAEKGFKFDLGPTFFLYPEILSEIFSMCGLDVDEELDLIKLDPNYRLSFEGGGSINATCDPVRMEDELKSICPRDASNLQAYMADNGRKLAAFKPILQNPFSSAADFKHLANLDILKLARPQNSVDRDLKRYFSDPRIRLAFSFQSKYLGMSPFKCPSLFTILSYMEYAYGVFHPRGGCGAISRKMAELATSFGATIQLSENVESIDFAGKRPRKIHTDKGSYTCDAMVMNADFAYSMEKLVPDRLRRRWTDRKLRKKKYSCSTYMMYLGIDGSYDLEHHNIFLSNNYENQLNDIEVSHRLSSTPSFYVCNPSRTDPTMAPPGKSALYVLVPVTHQHRNVDWQKSRDDFRATTLQQLRHLGIKDIEARIEYEKIITPADWESDMNIYRGATFNLAHSLGQMLNFRPNNRFEDLESVYLVGGGTHPGSGLPVIYEGARITSRLMVADFGMRPSWEPLDKKNPRPTSEVCYA